MNLDNRTRHSKRRTTAESVHAPVNLDNRTLAQQTPHPAESVHAPVNLDNRTLAQQTPHPCGKKYRTPAVGKAALSVAVLKSLPPPALRLFRSRGTLRSGL